MARQESGGVFATAMKLLLDTNIFLEAVFNQPQAMNARLLLNNVGHELFVSDFSLHSEGVQLVRRRSTNHWRRFLNDLILPSRVTVLVLPSIELLRVADVIQQYKLDFDDAYQYVIAEHHQLTLVSFDSDFDRTQRGRQTPQAINQLTLPNTPTS